MHGTQLLNIALRHDGEVPKGWLTGDTAYQKAAVLAAVAWHEVKDPTDPELVDCDLTHRENLIGIAESIIRGNMPDESPFAQRAAALWKTLTPSTEEILQ